MDLRSRAESRFGATFAIASKVTIQSEQRVKLSIASFTGDVCDILCCLYIKMEERRGFRITTWNGKLDWKYDDDG
jgi:hypothetical protein